MKWLMGTAAVVASIVLIAYVRTWNGELPYPGSVSTLEHQGQFGDSFGAFNALVSAFGFLGLLLTLGMQQWQISQQSKDLKRQADRDQENRRRDEMAQYEGLLFRLMEFYRDSVDEVFIVRGGKEYAGLNALALCIRHMQEELRQRKLHFVPEEILSPIRAGHGTADQELVLDYFIVENFRVVQYTVTYQRRVLTTLAALLKHLEHRCPSHADIDTYRALVSSQITHVEVQYLFAILLIYANESELRDLVESSRLFVKDSAPYNFKLHQYLYLRLWGKAVGDPSKARRLAFSSKAAAKVRDAAMRPPLADLLSRYRIAEPVRPEKMRVHKSNEP
ncbi:MAG: hypothetical protein K0S57_2642 [Ramlibacter sp.]|jgi:hypothetical protein|nr:hypothetical protein [Ramlibacter sp.]